MHWDPDQAYPVLEIAHYPTVLLLRIFAFGANGGRSSTPPPSSTKHAPAEHVCMRDNSSSPHPTERWAASLAQADSSLLTPSEGESDAKYTPSLPPSTTNFQYAKKSRFPRLKAPQLGPLFRGFERPNFSRIVVLTLLCLITYPVFHILTLVAKDKSLFVVRLIVSAWCSGAGFALGYILLAIAAQHHEAASEFTLIWY